MGAAGVKFFEQEPVSKISISKMVAEPNLALTCVSPQTTKKGKSIYIKSHFPIT
jgi:hypothetical protein